MPVCPFGPWELLYENDDAAASTATTYAAEDENRMLGTVNRSSSRTLLPALTCSRRTENPSIGAGSSAALTNPWDWVVTKFQPQGVLSGAPPTQPASGVEEQHSCDAFISWRTIGTLSWTLPRAF
ncbi:hypothetical protein SUNI508_03183 [Seiridium unicorne]|uniref:Uncharacterized protein n=1 Tax=Seiridium unicorne TaxID=138068 RepID=A0ABR2VDR3_9PEZI